MNNLVILFALSLPVTISTTEVKANAPQHEIRKNEPSEAEYTYMSKGIIDENFYDVIAVLTDIEKRPEWVYSLAKTEIIDGSTENKIIVYERIELPWPFNDRDYIVRYHFKHHQQDRIDIEFINVVHPDKPPLDGVVRVPHLKGHMIFENLASDQTKYIYHMDIKVGGWINEWLFKFLSQDLPEQFLQDLSMRVKKTKGHYKDFIQTYRKRIQTK